MRRRDHELALCDSIEEYPDQSNLRLPKEIGLGRIRHILGERSSILELFHVQQR